MKNTKKLFKFLGISTKTADCTVEEISRSPDSVSRDQNPETTQLDDGFVEARRPLSFNKPIPQVLSTRDVIPDFDDLETVPVPIEVRVVVKHTTTEDAVHGTQVTSDRRKNSAARQINLADGAFTDEPELPEAAEKVLDKTLAPKRGKLRKLKKAVGLFLPSNRKSTKISKVSPSAIIDDVTTLHVLNGDESSCDAVERLRQRVAMFYV